MKFVVVYFKLSYFVFQIAIFVCLIGLARCSVVSTASLVASPVLARISDDTIDPNPSYSFAYDVQDAFTGDSKGQIESRANGIVQGEQIIELIMLR